MSSVSHLTDRPSRAKDVEPLPSARSGRLGIGQAMNPESLDLLATVRSQVLVASVLVRDALLDPDATSVVAHRDEIEGTYDSIDDELNRYVPFLGSPAERERVDRLRLEVEELRSASEDVLRTDHARWSADARLLLQRVMPRREAAIRVSEEVQALNRSAWSQFNNVDDELRSFGIPNPTPF